MYRNAGGIATVIPNFATNVKQIYYSSPLINMNGYSADIQITVQQAYILKNDGAVYFWGSNSACLMGMQQGSLVDLNDPSKLDSIHRAVFPKTSSLNSDYVDTPVPLPELNNITEISVGKFGDTYLARASDGSVYEWGRDVTGFQYRSERFDTSSLNLLFHKFRKSSENSVEDIDNEREKIGNTTWYSIPNSCTAKPRKVVGISNVKSVVSGTNANLVLTSNGDVFSWGKGPELGLGKESPDFYNEISKTISEVIIKPAQVKNISKIRQLDDIGSFGNHGVSLWAFGLTGQRYEWGVISGSPFDAKNNTGSVLKIRDNVDAKMGFFDYTDFGGGVAVVLTNDGKIYVNTWSRGDMYLDLPSVRYVKQVGSHVWMFASDGQIYGLDAVTSAPVNITQNILVGK